MFLRTNKVSIIAIHEHRVKVERSRSIINKVMPGWEWCTNATNQSRGRIWVAWDPNRVKYKMIEHSIQFIHGKIQLRNGKEFHLTAVYGLHIISARSPLWSDI